MSRKLSVMCPATLHECMTNLKTNRDNKKFQALSMCKQMHTKVANQDYNQHSRKKIIFYEFLLPTCSKLFEIIIIIIKIIMIIIAINMVIMMKMYNFISRSLSARNLSLIRTTGQQELRRMF
jgi:hypothetical protein